MYIFQNTNLRLIIRYGNTQITVSHTIFTDW